MCMESLVVLMGFFDAALPPITPEREVELSRSIQRNFLPFRDKTCRTREEEACYRKGLRDRQILILSNLKLIAPIAKKYRTEHLSMEDLLEAGAVGLTIAADKFDPAKGCKFSTASYWWIRKYIAIEVSRRERILNVPSWMERLITKYNAVERNLIQKNGRIPKDSEILANFPPIRETRDRILNLDLIREIKEARNIHHTISLDTPTGFDLDDCRNIEIEDERSPMVSALESERLEEIWGKVKQLPQAYRDVVYDYLQLGKLPRSQKQKALLEDGLCKLRKLFITPKPETFVRWNPGEIYNQLSFVDGDVKPELKRERKRSRKMGHPILMAAIQLSLDLAA